MKINFARLNHVLIPTTKDQRDRLRESRVAFLMVPLIFLWETLTPDGTAFALSALLCGALGLEVTSNDTHLLWGALTGLLLGSVLLSRIYRLDGVRLRVNAPQRVTIGDELTFTLSAINEGARDRRALRFAGPFLPWDGRFTSPAPGLATLPSGETRCVETRARFTSRGEHHLDPFRVAALCPLGLAQGPGVYTGGCRFLVVPPIANVVRIGAPQGRRHQPGGVALASKTGESMDLRGVRPYRPGDPVRDLHARSWARTGVPVVREYQQEYFSRIGVILDTDEGPAGGLLARGPSRSRSQEIFAGEALEPALSLAAGVLSCLSRGEALIDLILVGDKVHPLTLGRSLGSFEQALDLLACVKPGPRFDGERVFASLSSHILRLSCVIFLALRWDAGRARLADRVRAMGVGCKVLLIAEEAPATGEDPPLPVSPRALARGEALFL